MPRRTLLTLLLLLLLTLHPGGARAWSLREESAPIPVQIDGQTLELEAFLARPDAEGRFPVALILHGAADSDGQVRDMDLGSNRQWARSLASRGWLAVSFARRGYAHSQGDAFLDVGSCAEPAPGRYLDHHADDAAAMLRALARREDTDLSRVLVIGKSVGGAVALDLAARPIPGIRAVVNISGGVAMGGRLSAGPGCDLFPAELVWNFARFGATARIPTIWLYAENDPWFPPALVGRLRTAYAAAGGQVDLTMLPAFPPDGHALFNRLDGQELLLPRVDAFLRRLGLPSWKPDLADMLLQRLAPDQRGVALRYLNRIPAHKALAVADSGNGPARWGSDARSLDAAEASALRRCEAAAAGPCHILARDFDPAGAAPSATGQDASPP